MAGIVQSGQKRLILIVVPQVRKKLKEKRRSGKKNMRRDKLTKKQTNIYHMYIYTNTYWYTNIYKYRYKYVHIHIIYYSNQIVLFENMLESI